MTPLPNLLEHYGVVLNPKWKNSPESVMKALIHLRTLTTTGQSVYLGCTHSIYEPCDGDTLVFLADPLTPQNELPVFMQEAEIEAAKNKLELMQREADAAAAAATELSTHQLRQRESNRAAAAAAGLSTIPAGLPTVPESDLEGGLPPEGGKEPPPETKEKETAQAVATALDTNPFAALVEQGDTPGLALGDDNMGQGNDTPSGLVATPGGSIAASDPPPTSGSASKRKAGAADLVGVDKKRASEVNGITDADILDYDGGTDPSQAPTPGRDTSQTSTAPEMAAGELGLADLASGTQLDPLAAIDAHTQRSTSPANATDAASVAKNGERQGQRRRTHAKK
jgi:hypothetical protein